MLLASTAGGAPAAAAPAAASASAHLAPPQVVLVAPPPPRDGVSPAQAAEIDRAIAAYHQRAGVAAAPKAGGALSFPFFPQAGIVGADLFLNNFTDQDPAAELVRDWDCSDYTYDGHQGHDSLIRTFREQAVGVPVFAVLPGVVVDVHDGEPDRNTGWNADSRANHVIVDHGGGLTTMYLHLRAGSVEVVPAQAVAAGTQLGLTGSSGISDWPHLHLETRQDNRWTEPSAGPCRGGESLWAAQPPVARDSYVADFYLTRGAAGPESVEAYLRDEAPRTGSFARGRQPVGARLDLRNLAASAAFQVRVVDPRGRVAFAHAGGFANRQKQHLAFALFAFELDLKTTGTWHLLADIEGMAPIDAPFRVVASGGTANLKPNRVSATLTPASPVAGEVLTCAVRTSAISEDPDYDVVGYRYEWRVNNRVVRALTSAALTDLLAADVARPGDKVVCKVTPTDLASAGPTATALGRNPPSGQR